MSDDQDSSLTSALQLVGTIVLAVAVITTVLLASAIGVGSVVRRVVGVSQFEATLLALVAIVSAMAVVARAALAAIQDRHVVSFDDPPFEPGALDDNVKPTPRKPRRPRATTRR